MRLEPTSLLVKELTSAGLYVLEKELNAHESMSVDPSGLITYSLKKNSKLGDVEKSPALWKAPKSLWENGLGELHFMVIPSVWKNGLGCKTSMGVTSTLNAMW